MPPLPCIGGGGEDRDSGNNEYRKNTPQHEPLLLLTPSS
jgi:hypothetical protein